MLPIKFLTIHCSATRANQPFSCEAVSAMARAHTGGRGYHHVVDQAGRRVRFLRDDEKGSHVGKHNTGNIGICYVGGLDTANRPADTRTAAQKRALRTLIRTYQARYPGIVVRGHRDWSPDLDGDGVIEPHEWMKACPSFDVAAWVKAGMPIGEEA